MIRFRVATYNIHRSRGMDWRVRPSRTADVVRGLHADIVALQEVVEPHLPGLCESIALPHVFGPAEKLNGHDYGNVVFSRFTVLKSVNYDISIAGRERRKCLRVDFEPAPGRVLHFFAVHLGTSYFERRRQAVRLISDEILNNSELTGARLIAGDFNEWAAGLTTRVLSKHIQSADILTHLERRKTYPGLMPFLHLDHFYFDAELKLCSMQLHRTSRSLLASDHLPLVADFEWS